MLARAQSSWYVEPLSQFSASDTRTALFRAGI
jgi:hypothetical protein